MGQIVYNTLSGTKEKFTPIKEGEVKMYLCGPTVYDYLHIGNFRGAITFNLIRNWLELNGQKVTFVYNYTDVDDKIIKRAIDEGVEASVISERFIAAFEEDFNRLGLKKHDHNPRVTEHMDDIVEMIKSLESKNKTYSIDGEVFYAIDEFVDYGKLSKQKMDELEAGQRVDVDSRKKNPHDFVLWKPSKEGEPSWDSPWGPGRPGWHIECSAMIKSILGDTIDIHGGGIDLIFPHHENEIAQSEGCNCTKYCNYWIHNNFINFGSEKMSKSLGNVVTCRSFMDKYDPEILKYLLLSAHYRSSLSITDEKIQQTIVALSRIYTALELANSTIGSVSEAGEADAGFLKKIEEAHKKIKKSLNDDFNTAEFISHTFEVVRAFNALGFASKKKNKNHKGNSEAFVSWMKKYGDMSALFNSDPSEKLSRFEDILVEMKGIDKKRVLELIDLRLKARDIKDWTLADKYRDELLSLGVEPVDGGAKSWRVKLTE